LLPSRSRLEGWNPDSLASSGSAVIIGGDAVEQAVDRINNNLKIMPETKAWSGQAHEAASGMFDRGHKQAVSFSDYASAVGKALSEGADWIGSTRTALLNKADDIDRGELHVSDQWVVLIKPAAMSAEKVAQLMEQVKIEQGIINGILLAVGAADDGTAAKVTGAAQPFGFVPPSPNGLPGMMIPGAQKPADDVPSPSDPMGIFQQNVMRGEDMGMTVRDTQEGYNEDGSYEKTLTMQDGSKHVITEYEYDYARGVPDMVTDEHWDANGNWISKTSSTRTPLGYNETVINWADGTQFVATETPDGQRTAAFTLPDGRHGVLPPDNPFFTGAVPTLTGGALTGLEAHIDRGGRLPMLSMDAVDKIGKGAKFGGPALGILTTIYDMGVAETPYDRCIAGFAGGFGVAGDAVGGSVGAGFGGLFVGGEAVTVPTFAIGGAYLGEQWMKSLGTKVGEAFC
jgi:hypothetical protein